MTESAEFMALATDIVSAYVSNNSLPPSELPGLISQVHMALAKTGEAAKVEPEAALVPAISPKKSITPDFLISLEDGQKYKSLKRHLATRGLSPDDYRAKWGLAKDYPMVAASYSAQRSSLAKSLGLGQRRAAVAAAAPEPAPEPVVKPKRGRRPKAA